MAWSYVSIRQHPVSYLFWSAFGIGGIAILLAVASSISRVIVAALLIAAALFTLWIQWQNGRGGFGTVHGLRPTYETRATLSPGRWLLLLLLLLAEAAMLALVLVGS